MDKLLAQVGEGQCLRLEKVRLEDLADWREARGLAVVRRFATWPPALLYGPAPQPGFGHQAEGSDMGQGDDP